MSALACAASEGNTEIARLLVDAGADKFVMKMVCADRTSAIYAASNSEIARLLLEAGADKDECMSALACAASEGHTEIARLLLDEDCWDTEHQTALMHAAGLGRTDLVDLLIKAGAKKDLQDEKLRTALMFAVAGRHAQTVWFLVEAGVEMDVQGKHWLTALMIADAQFKTALVKAATAGHTEMACLLLDAGADKDVCDLNGKSALVHAASEGHTEIAQLLVDAGAVHLEHNTIAKVLECGLPYDRELAWCRVEPIVPNAEIDIRVREICDNPALYSQYAVLETQSPQAPATVAVGTVLFGPGVEGNTLSLQFDGCNVGDCLDAVPQMIVAQKGELTWTLITQQDFDLVDPGPYEPHDPVAGVIKAYQLQPDTLYFTRVRLDCPSGQHMAGPFKEAEVPFPTMPGCKWSRHSNRSEMLECADNSFCNISADETCCHNLGGRLRCPPERPWMCSDLACDGDYCCEMDCAGYGGNRACNSSYWPANLLEIFEAISPSPARLQLTWGPRAYISGAESQCVFKRWDVQVAKVGEAGLESWAHQSQCDYADDRGVKTCTVDGLDFLQFYQVRFAELCTDPALDSLYNWTEPILVRGELAGSPVNVTVTPLDATSILLRWDPSTVGDCIFASWEVRWRAETGGAPPWEDAALCQDLTERNYTECIIDGLTAGESYSVTVAEACTDVRTNSLARQTEIFRWSEVGVWDIYLGANPTMSTLVSTLSSEVASCEVITTCCSDEFSICYGSTPAFKLGANIVRADETSGCRLAGEGFRA
eukprot:s925_g6.t1